MLAYFTATKIYQCIFGAKAARKAPLCPVPCSGRRSEEQAVVRGWRVVQPSLQPCLAALLRPALRYHHACSTGSQPTPSTLFLSPLLPSRDTPGSKKVCQVPEGTTTLTQILCTTQGQLIAKKCGEGRVAGRLHKDLPLPSELLCAGPMGITPPETQMQSWAA